jgi:CubicO group peptidase (beta-lactamase class C family)
LPRLRLIAIWLVVFSACACAAPGTQPSAGSASNEEPDLQRRLDTYLRERVNKGFSGVVLVAEDGEVVLSRAYSRDRSLTPETGFWIGSVSKTFTAAAILRLRDEGRLALSDPISRFFAAVPLDKQDITIRHLLTHTAGLRERYAADGMEERDQAVRAILAHPLERPPGAGYAYTNDAYNLLAAVIEVASEQPFEMFLRDQVLTPAGMTETGFWGERPVVPLAPSSKRRPGSNWGFRGATGMSSTVGDLYRWHLALLDDIVLQSGSRREAFAPQVQKANGGAYGYGWQVARTSRGTTLVAHGGAESELKHQAALYQYLDEGVVVIVLSNAREKVAQETLRGVLRKVFP